MEIVLTTPLTVSALVLTLAGLGSITWRNVTTGATLVVLLLPTYLLRIREGWFTTNALELSALVFLLVVGIRVLLRREHLTPPPRHFWIPLALLTAGGLITAVIAGMDPGTLRITLGAWKGFIAIPTAFVLAAVSVERVRDSWEKLLITYAASATVVAGTAILLSVLNTLSRIAYSPITYDGRLRGFHESPNQLAMYVLPALVLLMTGAATRRYSSKIGPFLLSPFSFLLLGVLLWTQSAGALLGLVAALGIFLGTRRFGARFIRHAAYCILLVGLLAPFIGAQFADTAWEEEWRSPVASRMMIWRAGTEMLETDWLLGIGPGMFQERYLALQEQFPPYLEWAVPHPHNLMLAVWLSTGLLGLVGFAWLLLAAFKKIQNPDSRIPAYQIAASAALTAMLVHGIVDTTVLKNDFGIFFLVCGVAITIRVNAESTTT
jgi:O-antigen ligase